MGTANYPCGCSITTSMFNHAVMSVFHCQLHWILHNPDKTLNQMANEIRDIWVQSMAESERANGHV